MLSNINTKDQNLMLHNTEKNVNKLLLFITKL